VQAQQRKNNVPLAERQKRMTVLTRQREAVLISIPKARLLGLPEVDINKEKRNEEHGQEAERRGLNAAAYQRGQSDTGYCVVEKVEEVSLRNLLGQLTSLGFYYCGGRVESWMRDGNILYKSILEFSTDKSKEQRLTRTVLDEFSRYTFTVYVWANYRFRNEELGREGGQYRLDTINCPDARELEQFEKPERYLNIQGNTYGIQEAD